MIHVSQFSNLLHTLPVYSSSISLNQSMLGRIAEVEQRLSFVDSRSDDGTNTIGCWDELLPRMLKISFWPALTRFLDYYQIIDNPFFSFLIIIIRYYIVIDCRRVLHLKKLLSSHYFSKLKQQHLNAVLSFEQEKRRRHLANEKQSILTSSGEAKSK